MAVKIRLKRMGKIRAPFYRVVVMDSRTKRDGRAIEEIGKYHPTAEPSLIQIDGERAQYWLKQGAQPTEATLALLKITGDWQTFKGESGTEGTLQVAEPKPAKKDLYEAALSASGDPDEAKRKAAAAKKRAADEVKAAAKAAKEAEQAAADKSPAEPAKAEAVAGKAESAKTEAVAEQTERVEVADAAKAPEATEAAVESAPASTQAEPAAAEPEKAAEQGASDKSDEAKQVEAELPAGALAATKDGKAPEGHAIKGNRDSMKYHEPDGRWYEQTVAELWFATAADAEAAGFVKAGG